MSRLFGFLPGQYVGFGCGQARTLIQEWARVVSTGKYSHIYEDVMVKQLAPALCLGYQGDDLCPEKSVAELASLLNGEVRMLETARKTNPHSSWARSPVESVALIEHWLESKGLISSG